MTTLTQDELKEKCIGKIARKGSGVKGGITATTQYLRILQLSITEDELNPDQEYMLQHFLDSPKYILANTIYWEDQVIYPVRTSVKTHRLKVKKSKKAK